MRSPRQRKPVIHDIRSIPLHWPDMSGFHFRPATPVDEFQSGNRTSRAICRQHNTPKNTVPKNSRYQNTYPVPRLFSKIKGSLRIGEFHSARRRFNARQIIFIVWQPDFYDPIEIRLRYRPNRRLRTPRNTPLIVQQAPLDEPIGAAERHMVHKRQIAPRLDDSEIHPGRVGIGNDRPHLRHSEIAPRGWYLHRLVIDDPVARALLRPREVRTRKLAPLGGMIIVDRIGSMNENPECHPAPALRPS